MFELINPATGLSMIGDGIAGVDVAGNPYGMDMHSIFSTTSSITTDDIFDPMGRLGFSDVDSSMGDSVYDCDWDLFND